jgi:hypothetical protein
MTRDLLVSNQTKYCPVCSGDVLEPATYRIYIYKSLQLCCQPVVCEWVLHALMTLRSKMAVRRYNMVVFLSSARSDIIRHSIPWPSAQEIVGSSTDGKGVHGAEWDSGERHNAVNVMH